ncbi:MAG: RNA polymerase sigma-70 factor, partial [Bacteroidota bacterium]|nr:RNA polymerase sigma-70 factor [Bacteroidota bacterium]MDX5431451.1 RNA polymerase sigma-70 factor [Bacteroidota bacterium]MDX5470179.1 RNA polymerase sigma-70 factor [Bacteroidota bacterium]
HFATPMLKDQDRARDMVQDVFSKLWERREELQITASIKAYLYMAVRNHCLNVLKKDERISWTDDETSLELNSSPVESTYRILQEKDLQGKLKTCLDALPEKCRQVFEMSRFDDMSNKEIAETLGISVKTVENQMTKALHHMRAHLLPFLKASLNLLLIYFSAA